MSIAEALGARASSAVHTFFFTLCLLLHQLVKACEFVYICYTSKLYKNSHGNLSAQSTHTVLVAPFRRRTLEIGKRSSPWY